MNENKLALLGGTPVSRIPWPETCTIGEEEKRAVLEVLDSGVLSSFRATAGPDFDGGPRVKALEEAWARHFGVASAISFNSLTTGLFAAVGAVGVGPGDEVIVSPLSMQASATCALVYGGVPVFADIDPATCCLDPESVRERVTERTKAIVVVHLFGHPADMDPILEIAREHDLAVIEDCAQAPGALYKGAFTGTIGDIGGFSLNYHKTIHSGEGGVMVTDDDELAMRLRLIRNHGEACVEGLGIDRLDNTFGGNYRMTEIEAAIAFEQLAKLERLTVVRLRLAARLDLHLQRIAGVAPLRARAPGSRHVYYVYAMDYDQAVAGLPRDRFVEAVRAEGIELRKDYARPIYWEPMFQRQIAIGSSGFPFVGPHYRGRADYRRGLCPAAERVHSERLLFGKFCRWPLEDAHVDMVAAAFEKVLAARHALLEAGA